MGVIKLGGSSRSAELHSISITANRFISRRFSKGFGLAGVRMEFRVYAAFGYVTKVVSNGRVNAKLHATPRNWLRLCRAALYRRILFCRMSKSTMGFELPLPWRMQKSATPSYV